MTDFESMKVGDIVPMSRGEWDGAPRAQFNAASEYHAQHPEVQFEVLSQWELNKNRGIEELVFKLKRIR